MAGSRSASSCAGSDAASTSSWRRPGRAVDHLKRGSLSLDDVAVVVLDEADEMLDMGFAEDLETILARNSVHTPDGALLGDDLADDRPDRRSGT